MCNKQHSNKLVKESIKAKSIHFGKDYSQELSILFTELKQCRFRTNKDERFADMILNALETCSENIISRAVCIAVLTNINYHVGYNKMVLDFIKAEYFRQDSGILSKQEVIEIAFCNWYGEESFAFIAEVYKSEKDISIKKIIVRNLIDFAHCGIYHPSLQRVYCEINTDICSWDDEILVGEWLAMVMRVHKETIFDDAEEVILIVETLDDDVFQVFIDSLVSTFKDYEHTHPVDPICMYDTLVKLVNERNHPRKKWLLNKVEILKNYVSERDVRENSRE